MPGRPRGRVLWLDLLRVGGAFSVVAFHTASGLTAGGSDGGVSWAQCARIGLFRWGVPVFVLVSGALLLDPTRTETARAFYRKRLARIAIPLLFWSAYYIVWKSSIWTAAGGLRLDALVSLLVLGRPRPFLWYLYMTVGLYCFTPFLRVYVRSSTNRERWWLVAVAMTVAVLHNFWSAVQHAGPPSVFAMWVPYTAYYLGGHQLRELDVSRFSARGLLVLVLGCAAVVAVACPVVVDALGLGESVLRGFLHGTFGPGVVVMSAAIFLLARKLWHDRAGARPVVRRIGDAIAPATLGIYVVHPAVAALLHQRLGLRRSAVGDLAFVPLATCATFVASYVLVALMLRVPYLRRTVG